MTDFELTFHTQGKNIEEILKKIKKDGEKEGIHIDGDSEKGSFYSKNVRGNYEINNSIVKISISSMFFIPASLIQEEIQKYFK